VEKHKKFVEKKHNTTMAHVHSAALLALDNMQLNTQH